MFKENFKEKEKLVTGPDCGLTPGQTGQLTVGRKITLSSVQVSQFLSWRWVRITPL
jgi:hypothetical protein